MICHVQPIPRLGVTFANAVSKLIAQGQTSLLPRFSEKRRPSFELWALKELFGHVTPNRISYMYLYITSVASVNVNTHTLISIWHTISIHVVCRMLCIHMYIDTCITRMNTHTTGWRRPIGCLESQSFSAKEPLIIGLFCRKWPIKIRHPMDVCLSVHVTLLYSYDTSFVMYCMSCIYLYICIYIDRWTTRMNTHTESNPLVFARYITPMNVSFHTYAWAIPHVWIIFTHLNVHTYDFYINPPTTPSLSLSLSLFFSLSLSLSLSLTHISISEHMRISHIFIDWFWISRRKSGGHWERDWGGIGVGRNAGSTRNSHVSGFLRGKYLAEMILGIVWLWLVGSIKV